MPMPSQSLIFSLFVFIFILTSFQKNSLLSHLPNSQPEVEQEKDFDLKKYRWKNRLILISAPDHTQKELLQSWQEIRNYPSELKERDLKCFFFTSPAPRLEKKSELAPELFKVYPASAWPSRLKIDKKYFQILLIGKDGGVKYQSTNFTPFPQLFALIDQMPMRKQEMKKKD